MINNITRTAINIHNLINNNYCNKYKNMLYLCNFSHPAGKIM